MAISISSNMMNLSQPRNKDPISLIGKCKSLRELKQIQGFAIKTQRIENVLSKLIRFCTAKPSRESIENAEKLFDEMSEGDIILFNTIANAYAHSLRLRLNPLRAIEIFSYKICQSGTQPDLYTFPSLLKACSVSTAIEEGTQLHCHVIKLGFDSDVYVLPALINMYSACGHVESARRAFHSSNKPCVVTYNALICGYVRNARPNEALSLFRTMQATDVAPNEVTMLSVLCCCAQLGALDLGRWVHQYLKNEIIMSNDVKVNTALVDMYAKCGSLEEAESVFAQITNKDTPACSAMIMAYATHGRVSQAFSVFQQMNCRPDDVTFLGLLYACNHAGLVRKGRQFFARMREDYGIVPNIKHYGCMVDLLGRAGKLYEAYRFIKQIPMGPKLILWRTLLSACCTNADFDLGKRVIQHIFELDDAHGGDYVIFSNLCAKVGKWEEFDVLRKRMIERGVVKIPGCSSIEVNNVVHEFFSGGDGSDSPDVYRALDELMVELERVGYKADVSLVCHDEMNEEEKELSLRYHSEKLAIAYGILNTSPGKTIRVVKNLRVCRDCHSMAKYVSLVSRRLIVLRDVHRFHHFNEGKCSCADYW